MALANISCHGLKFYIQMPLVWLKSEKGMYINSNEERDQTGLSSVWSFIQSSNRALVLSAKETSNWTVNPGEHET